MVHVCHLLPFAKVGQKFGLSCEKQGKGGGAL